VQGCQVAVLRATFLKCASFKKMYGRGKFIAVIGRKVAVNLSKMLKCGRRKLFLKIPIQTESNTAISMK
jgi:hypothetical protein